MTNPDNFFTAESGAKARRQRGARAAHAAMRAKNAVPGAAGSRAAAEKRRLMRIAATENDAAYSDVSNDIIASLLD